MTVAFEHDTDMVKIRYHTKWQCKRSLCSKVIVWTNRDTHRL